MPGVQSFVAQRQHIQADPSRHLIGVQQRIPIPTTKLEKFQQRPLFQKQDSNLRAGSPVAEPSNQSSRQQYTESSALLNGFDTDGEGFDETMTASIGGSTRGHHGVEEAHSPLSGQYGIDAANQLSPRDRSFSQRGQEQPYDARGTILVVADASEAEEEEEEEEEVEVELSNGGSEDEKRAAESGEEELVNHEILQDLNSPGFSQYLQGETSYTTQAAFAPFTATPVVYRNLASRDAARHLQRPATALTSPSDGIDSGASDPVVNLKPGKTKAHIRTKKQTLATPIPKDQISFSAQHYKVLDCHGQSERPIIIDTHTLQPMPRVRVGVAERTALTNRQSQADEEKFLSMQAESIDPSGDNSPVDRDPNVDREHHTKPAASTRKRARDLDYSPDQLSSMTFQQLNNEPFTLAFDTPWTSPVQGLSSGTLAEKMEYVLEKQKDDDAKLMQRRAFFSSLPIEQYEECANLMIRRFSDIMSKFTEARQQRRRFAKDFEEEVARREDCVRGKTSAVNRDLGRLKRGGEEVVRGGTL
ncbi:extracellular mutant protein 11-domain-containing protein [Usnea florida]